MTAPALQLFVREGRRFVRVSETRPARPLPPIPRPVPLAAVETAVDPLQPTATNPVVEVQPGHYRLYAPKCPHGYFLRYALGSHVTKTGSHPNCPPCHRSAR